MAVMFILQNQSLSHFWILVATAIDINSNSCINLRLRGRIANDYLRNRNSGLSGFQ